MRTACMPIMIAIIATLPKKFVIIVSLAVDSFLDFVRIMAILLNYKNNNNNNNDVSTTTFTVT